MKKKLFISIIMNTFKYIANYSIIQSLTLIHLIITAVALKIRKIITFQIEAK